MSVSKIREGSGGTEWIMGLPATAAGRASALSLFQQGGSLSTCLRKEDSCFSSDRLNGRRIGDENWESESHRHPSERRSDY